ncbi:solute carrier family 49 member 4 homolog [Homarus americanus]|uniref:solute carrier family 49 member 4 homolog n=1 Tax=Homarus americanus TaxID=6706 RepID=UPI001C47DDDA|nr:solute carrier family 49 member 4 homolog [Homarus americanus]XP_042211988.1 solute carrier family 49 member 4 homolog [Homarus americanus]
MPGADDLQAIVPEDIENTVMMSSVEVRVYKRRWWILFLFAGMGFMQCAVWNTWGPITASVKLAYPNWDDAEIALLSMWGTITMIMGLAPMTLLLQTKGIRVALLLTVFLMAAGTSIRCFTTEEIPFTILAHIGAVLNGFAGIIIGAAPSLISSRWFPARERTTATGIGCTFNQLGNAGGFFLGPWLVQLPRNHTRPDNSTHYISSDEVDDLRRSIRDYMWITAGLCIALFVGVVSYFPDKPHKPPSLTSFIRERPNPFVKDIKLLLSNKNIWLLVVPYSITLGINVAWSSVLDINLAPFDISQDEASWLGVYVTLGGVVMALLSARFSDLLFGYMKLTIIVLMTFATAGYTWFLLLMNGCLPYNKVELFISVISGASFNYACSPLFFELAVELAYPVPEGVVGAFLTMCWNIVAASFLLTMQTPLKSNVIWMDYLLAIQGLVVVCLMIFVREEYKRTTLDRITAGTDNQTNQSVDQEVQVQA